MNNRINKPRILKEADFLEGDGVAVFAGQSKAAKELHETLELHNFAKVPSLMWEFYSLYRLPGKAAKALAMVENGTVSPADLKAEISNRRKTAEAVRASITRPLVASRDRVIAIFREQTNEVDNVEASVDALVKRMRDAARAAEEAQNATQSVDIESENEDLVETIRIEDERGANDPEVKQQAEVRIEANTRRLEALQRPVLLAPTATASGANVGSRKAPLEVRITDMSKVPLEFLVVDKVKIRKALIADKKLEIPGVERYHGEDKLVVARPKGV